MNFETNNLVALFQQGKTKEAFQQAYAIINKSPANYEAHNVMGLILLSNNAFEKARISFRKAAKLCPSNPDYQHNIARAYYAENKVASSKKVLNKIIKRNKKYAYAYNTLGSIYFDEKNYVKALDLFNQAIVIDGSYLDAIFNLANTYNLMGELSLAVKWYHRLYSINNKDKEVKSILVGLYLKSGSIDKALDFSEDDADCVYQVAVYLEGKTELDKALESVEKCLILDSSKLRYKRLKATILRRMGNISDALKLLEAVDYDDADIQTKVFLEFELAKLYDSKESYDKAFKHYRSANALNNQLNPITSVSATNFINHLDAVYNILTEDWVNSWQADFSNREVRKLVFMVAFPRSGTTLLDQVLDGHSEFAVMEELPIVSDVIKKAIKITGGSYPGLLSGLARSEIQKLRSYYFKRVDEQFEYDKSKTLVDKLPLNIVELELIHLLFPQSKIILSMRHPYDVCLSNYMQHYSANEAMMNFNTLDGVALTYHKVMRFWDKYLSVFPELKVHVVRYEDLVGNMESELRDLIKFLDVDWQPQILDFHQHALKRQSLTTPSYQQVTQPLYTSSRYRWKNYANYIGDDFRCLDNYVDKFGYDLTS